MKIQASNIIQCMANTNKRKQNIAKLIKEGADNEDIY